MLTLLIRTSSELYAIEAKQVVEILPVVIWRKLPGAPAGVVGVINYHGTPTPVLDLAEFVSNRASELRMSTRIVVINYADDAGEFHRLGVIAEQVLETISLDETSFVESGVSTPDAPYLGRVVATGKGIIQKLDLRQAFPADVRKHLFRALEEDASNAG